MQDTAEQNTTGQGILLPQAPVLLAGLAFSVWISPDGESERLGNNDLSERIGEHPPLVCHRPATAQRLGVEPFACYDVLELLAFTHPGVPCVPTPRGLAAFWGLSEPATPEDAALVILDTATRLLRELAARGAHFDPQAAGIARNMMAGGWLWGPAVLSALGAEAPHRADPQPSAGLRVWERLDEWQETPPETAPGQDSVCPTAARQQLARLLGDGAEQRQPQSDFTAAVAQAFAPRQVAGEPNIVLAEAGTGIGKTLGYIAPASLWTAQNEAPVWVSTYTRNLQTQIDSELDRLYPQQWQKKKKVVIRKGRENYLCLLNLEDATQRLITAPQDAVAVGLMSRWAAQTRNGDMVGGDFPGWLVDLMGVRQTLGLTDRRGECLSVACPHYRRCFIERNIRKARKADIVVANHALVLTQAAGGREDGTLPTHYVFDEGHHLFDAADSAFCAQLSALEAQELRRWLVGDDTPRTGRARGLKKRIEDLTASDSQSADDVAEIQQAATRGLIGTGWANRLSDQTPKGPMEKFLAQVQAQVLARTNDSPYSLEAATHPPTPGLLESAADLKDALKKLLTPVVGLCRRLDQHLDEEAAELDSDNRRRIDSTIRVLTQRVRVPLEAWISMLDALKDDTPEDFTDWFCITRANGHDHDIGLHRHWVDPMRPFADTLLSQAHGVVMTSATLTDGRAGTQTGQEDTGTEQDDWEQDWAGAEQRSGTVWLPNSPTRVRFPSPYDYAEQTRVLIVNDLQKNNMAQVAAAYRELFLAAGGGALGLFTAIARLRAVHAQINSPLDTAGLPLYAQHIDGMNTTTLIDIFRAERHSCLLGTDAVRDGVDVPGDSLRLIVFDRVPWPRPTIAHKARKARFGGSTYADSLTRLKLKQAYGRLVRRENDRGVFVLLDSMLPTRLSNAFPPAVTPQRCGLAEAIALTRDFLTVRP